MLQPIVYSKVERGEHIQEPVSNPELSDSDTSLDSENDFSLESDIKILTDEEESLLDFQKDGLGQSHEHEECDIIERSDSDIPNLTSPSRGETPNSSQKAIAVMQRLFNTIILHVCLFLAFFQLCYKVSERGITLLLNFFRSIISWVSTFTNSTDLLSLCDTIPRNIYFLKKVCGSNSSLVLLTFVVCPKCQSIYDIKDCSITARSGLVESAKCPYVQYPNHPHASCREKCNTLLMKRVKHGSTYKLLP